MSNQIKLAKTAEEEEILKELCSANGLTYGRLGQEGLSCVRLEMFFSGFSKFSGLDNFPNLQVLCIIGQSIHRIEGLSAVPKLKELWVAECQLQKIDGFSGNKQLRRLYLYDNMIKKIENIEHLTELEKLWLNKNEIKQIEGINKLKYLRDLNLAENQIEKVGSSLNGLQYLEILELSDNCIYSFKDLTNLTKLPGLRELGLNSPKYKANPGALLCNYTTHILYHLPDLTRLDTYDICNKAIKDLAETTVLKKKMYYNMKAKTLRRHLADLQKKLTDIKDEYCTVYLDKLTKLHLSIKEVEREIQELSGGEDELHQTHDSGTESDKDAREQKAIEDKSATLAYKNKQKVLKDRVKKWDKKLAEIEHHYNEASERLKQTTEMTIHRLATELQTGGNVRYEDGKPADVWFTSCHDLVLSRFCAADYKEQGILGIRIHRITRVHNRILRSRFDDKLASIVDTDDSYMPTAKASNYKKLLEYLFWIWEPDLPGGQHEPARILEDGFMDAKTYKLMNREAAVPLTNSISLADKPRMQHLQRLSRGKEYADSCPYRYGQLVVSKVYIGKSAQATDGKHITKDAYPKADSIMRPRKELCSANHKPACECSSRQCEWFIFDNQLVMPEYVIDFEYVTKEKARSPFASCTVSYLENRDPKVPLTHEEILPDDEIIHMEPVVRPRPRVVQLSEDVLIKMAKATSLTAITVLNLHGNGLTKIKSLQSLPALKKLIVSFNELTRLDDVAQMNIEYLDASFNKLVTLEGLKGMNKLKHLDVSWNKLTNTRDDVSIIRKHCPVLATLDLRHNKWQKPEGIRLRAIGRIKSLTKLNGSSVTEIEATSALRLAAGSRVSQVSLLAHSRTDPSKPRSLSLDSTAQALCQISRNKPDRMGDQDNLWYSKVTTLNLDGQHISKLSNLDRLENLKWASFCDNDITRIEGLDCCINLEELGLENNCISRIEGLSHLTKLRKLSLGHNYISVLDGTGLERLTQLHFLSLESNQVSNLLGLQRVIGLSELYIGNNHINNIREVFYLKNLPNLVIFDLCGNPVAVSADNYRLFVIYHLKSLKALDGTAIESTEGGQAKDTFGGRLTQDFVAERLGHSNFHDVRELDFPQCGIRTVDIGMGDLFLNLRSVNLEHNNMTSFSGLVYLVNLRVLCLNHNHIECIIARPKQQPPTLSKNRNPGLQNAQAYNNMLNSPENYTPVLENLEVLHLGYNGIKDLAALQLGRLTSLKALFLQGNEITKIEGLEGLQDLRELVLDRNKIKNIGEFSFVNQWNLQELHLEENRLKDLTNIGCLENLQRLFLGMNRIQDLGELERLDPLMKLVELSVVSNAVARRMLHRPLLVYRMPSLLVIDGIPISEEERAKAELYFMEQQPPMSTTIETTLPGIGQYKTQIPVKVTNMQLMSGPYYDKQWGGPIHLSDEALQQEVQRVLSKQNLTMTGGGRRQRPPQTDSLQGIAAPMGLNPNKVSGTMSYQHTGNQGGGRQVLNSTKHYSAQLSQVPYVPHQQSQGDYSKTVRR